MKKLLTSVVLSTALVVGLLHVVPEHGVNYQEMRQATWSLDFSFSDRDVGEQTFGFCSGVAIAPDVLLTAAHCDLTSDEQFLMFGPPDAKFTVDGHPYTILKRDENKDLMLIKVEGLNSPVVKFIPFVPEVDRKVYVDGFP